MSLAVVVIAAVVLIVTVIVLWQSGHPEDVSGHGGTVRGSLDRPADASAEDMAVPKPGDPAPGSPPDEETRA